MNRRIVEACFLFITLLQACYQIISSWSLLAVAVFRLRSRKRQTFPDRPSRYVLQLSTAYIGPRGGIVLVRLPREVGAFVGCPAPVGLGLGQLPE
jgi:hypothetical protein